MSFGFDTKARDSLLSPSQLEQMEKENHQQLSIEEEMEELIPELKERQRMVSQFIEKRKEKSYESILCIVEEESILCIVEE